MYDDHYTEQETRARKLMGRLEELIGVHREENPESMVQTPIDL